jgi:hypothetical protein
MEPAFCCLITFIPFTQAGAGGPAQGKYNCVDWMCRDGLRSIL